jgi:hypothetical protein
MIAMAFGKVVHVSAFGEVECDHASKPRPRRSSE